MSYSFTAASSHKLSVATVPVATSPITISAWIKPVSIGASNLCVTALTDTANGNTRFALVQNTTNVSANAHDGAAAGSSTSSAGSISTSAWNHVAATFVTTTSRFGFLGGSAGTENTTSVNPASIDTTTIGARTNTSTTWYFDGLIAEVAYWNVVLSGADITALAAGASPMSLSTLPVAYWPLSSDGALADVIASRTLTATGATYNSDHPAVGGGAGKARLLTGVG